MVASCASSRGHIGLTGAPCGGGAAGFICAQASTLSALAPSSAAQARIHREKGVISVSGISGHSSDSAQGCERREARPTRLPLAASRGSVTSFPGRRCGARAFDPAALALAGNGDVFVATGMVAIILVCLGNRPGYFIGIDAPVGRGLGEIPRPAIG